MNNENLKQVEASIKAEELKIKNSKAKIEKYKQQKKIIELEIQLANVTKSTAQQEQNTCTDCGTAVSEDVEGFSSRKYGKILCRACQNQHTKIQ